MKAKLSFLTLIILAFNTRINAQNSLAEHYLGMDTNRIHNWYAMNASEIIFSGGQVKSDGVMLDNVARFTAFFHFQRQFHYNFSSAFGMFTGFGLRNVGFINTIPVSSEGDATIKQRSYSLGFPLALKIGDMKKGAFLALGAEAEFMFAYKEKILYNDQKYKYYETISHWFSNNDVNLFNPSLFADIRFNHGGYIRFKYYLMDFLRDKDMSFIPPTSTTTVIYQPESSKLFYVAIGTSFRDRKHKKKHAKATEV